MKNIFIIFVAGIMFLACSSHDFTIEGTISNDAFNGGVIEIKKLNKNLEPLETVSEAVIKNSEFTLKGDVEEPMYVVLMVDNQSTIYFFLEKGEFSLYVDNENFANCHTKGSPLNDTLTDFSNKMTLYAKTVGAIYKKMEGTEGEERSSIEKEYNAKQVEIKDYYNIVITNNLNLVGTLVFANAIFSNVFTYEEATEIHSKFIKDEKLKSSIFLNDLERDIENLKKTPENT